MKKIIRINQLTSLFVAQSKELRREPAVLFWGIVFPILMALGLGFAFTQKSEIVRSIAVIKEAHPLSFPKGRNSQLENFLQKNAERQNAGDSLKYKLTIEDEKLGNTTYIFRRMSREDAIVLLKRGEISIILEQKNGNIEYNFDPVNPDAQLIYLNLSGIINKGDAALTGNNDNIQPLTVTGTRYIDFLVPGLISMGIMLSSIWGIGYNMIEKRSKKLLRRMIATPMKKSHFLVSLMTVRTIMNFIEGTLLFLFSYLVFDVTIQGSLPALILIFLASNVAFAGIAILSASRTASLEVGNGLINAVATPMMILSGIFFSYHNFPDWVIAFIKYLPLTLLADGLRGIFIEGAGFAEITLPFFILLATGVVCFSIGLRVFRWH